MTNGIGFAKLTLLARRAGRQLLEKALILYYVLQDHETPAWARTVVLSALGYLVLPIDGVPDFLPGGLVDDLGVLAAALATVAAHVTPEIVARARRALAAVLGEPGAAVV